MESRLPSPSKHDVALLCPGSFALPHSEYVGKWSTRGRVIHAFLADVPLLGRAAALAKVPKEFKVDCEVIDLSVLPACQPEAYASEVTLAYNVDTGEAREVGRNLTREQAYATARPGEMLGTMDVVGLTDDAVIVPDYKTGHHRYGPAKEIRQLRAYALLATRAYGKRRAVSGIISIREDGTSYYDKCELDEFDLACVEVEIHELVTLVRAEQARVAAGGTPKTVEGDHCARCPAISFCPSKMRLVRQFAAAPQELEDLVVGATEEQLGEAWQRADALEKVVERVKEAIRHRAEQRPIPLPSGKVIGPVPTEKLLLDQAAAALSEMFGPFVAAAATESESRISKTSVERALRDHVQQPGVTLKALMKKALDAIREAGGVQIEMTVKPHKPKELPATDAGAKGVAA